MMEDVKAWSENTFCRCELGDQRRTARLVRTAANIASHIGRSIVQCSPSEADIEGSYRLIRNDQVKAEAIAEGGFQATAALLKGRDTVLALEDSTSLSYPHSVREELGYTNSQPNSRHQGMLVHSVMLYDPEQGQTLGLIEQSRWVRDITDYGKRKRCQKTAYAEKL